MSYNNQQIQNININMIISENIHVINISYNRYLNDLNISYNRYLIDNNIQDINEGDKI